MVLVPGAGPEFLIKALLFRPIVTPTLTCSLVPLCCPASRGKNGSLNFEELRIQTNYEFS